MLTTAEYFSSATAAPNSSNTLLGTGSPQILNLPPSPADGTIVDAVSQFAINNWTITTPDGSGIWHYKTTITGGVGGGIVIPPGMGIQFVYSAVNARWIVVGGGFTPGYLLATQQYAPAALKSYTVVGGTMTALDTTNATLSLIVPPSGNVDIRAEFTANCTRGAAANNALLIALLDHTSSAVVGDFISVMVNAITSSTQIVSASRIFHLTGLTPGAKQVDLAAADVTAAGNAAFIYAQGQSSVISSGVVAPLLLEAIAA